MTNAQLSAQIEALLFALGKPLSRQELIGYTGASTEELEAALAALSTEEGRGVSVVDDGTQLELRVAAGAASLVEQVRKEEHSRDIGKAGLEVLAAVLYRGPLTRAEIDFIRGVNSSQTLRTLTMRGLVRKVPNPKDTRSFTYEPTTDTLAELGVAHRQQLPEYEEVRQKLEALERSYRQTAAQTNDDSA